MFSLVLRKSWIAIQLRRWFLFTWLFTLSEWIQQFVKWSDIKRDYRKIIKKHLRLLHNASSSSLFGNVLSARQALIPWILSPSYFIVFRHRQSLAIFSPFIVGLATKARKKVFKGKQTINYSARTTFSFRRKLLPACATTNLNRYSGGGDKKQLIVSLHWESFVNFNSVKNERIVSDFREQGQIC